MNKHLLRNGLMFSTLIAIPIALPTAYANEGTGGSSAQAEVQMMDTNHDGVVPADEHAAGAKQMFAKMDADHDGNVTATEMDAASVWREGIPINEKAGFAPASCQISLSVSSAYRAPSPADRDGHSKKSGAEQH